MIQTPSLLQIEVAHALSERPKAPQQVGPDRSLGEVEVGGYLLRGQPLLETKCYRGSVLAR